MKKLFVFLVLAFAFLVAAPRLAVADANMDRLAERAVALVERMANIIDADKSNCDKMGADLNKFADDTAAERAELKSYKDRLTPEQKAAFKAKYGERLKAAAAKIMGGMLPCATNEKVRAAMAKMKDTTD